jgi:hypothetical protein
LDTEKGIAKQLAAFERKMLGRMFGGIKVNENWRKSFDTEMMLFFRDLDMLSFVRISQLNCIGHVNRKVSKVFNNNPQGRQLIGPPKNRWLNCVHTDINKCKIGKRGQETELTGRSP